MNRATIQHTILPSLQNNQKTNQALIGHFQLQAISNEPENSETSSKQKFYIRNQLQSKSSEFLSPPSKLNSSTRVSKAKTFSGNKERRYSVQKELSESSNNDNFMMSPQICTDRYAKSKDKNNRNIFKINSSSIKTLNKGFIDADDKVQSLLKDLQLQQNQKTHKQQMSGLKSTKNNIRLVLPFQNIIDEEEVIYDESPAKMKILKQKQKFLLNQLKGNEDLSSQISQLEQFQQELTNSNYASKNQKNSTFFEANKMINLESIDEKEDILSSEVTPKILDLLSPITPDLNCLESFQASYKKDKLDHNKGKNLDQETMKQSSQLKFNSTYKKIDKIVQINNHFNAQNALDVDMLKQTLNQTVLPRNMGIIQQECNSNKNLAQQQQQSKQQSKLNLQNQNISWRYKDVISSALSHKQLNQLLSLNLSNNNLNSQSLRVISSNLPKTIQKLNLSQNNISQQIDLGLAQLLDSSLYPNLRRLNLENNNISSLGLSSIIDALVNNKSLEILNLSHNNLTDGCGDVFRKYLQYSSYLKELYLHWNKISSQGGLAISEGLEHNTTLQVLDLSHNGIGLLQKLRCGIAILKNCSILGSSMRHLDLSYNMFQDEECVEMASFLDNHNQTLYGIHFQGNQGWGVFDARGFMRIRDNELQNKFGEVKQLANIVQKRRIKGNKIQKYASQIRQQNILNNDHQRDICWICEGWQQVRFEIKEGCSDSFLGGPVYLHLDFDNFVPHKMEDEEEKGVFVLYKMCPPKSRIHFFFSDPTQPTVFYSKHHPYKAFKKEEFEDKLQFCLELDIKNTNQISASPEENKKKSIKTLKKQTSTKNALKQYFLIKYQNKKNKEQTGIQFLKPSLLNCLDTPSGNLIIDQDDAEIMVNAKPRVKDDYYEEKEQEWTKDISLFRSYIPDSEELLNRCFEIDWKNSKLEKLVGACGDNLAAKNILKQNYQSIINIYKYLATIGMNGDIPSISYNKYSSLLVKTKVLDNKLLKNSDSDIIFYTCNSNANAPQPTNEQNASFIQKEVRNYTNPEKALVRHEFLELFGRLALEKYQNKGAIKQCQDAICALFNEKDLQDQLNQQQSPQVWREERYWNKQCDEVMKKYLGFLKILWERWADSKKTEKRGFYNFKSMSVFEFCEMARSYDLLDEKLTERELLLSYNLAMMTQEDELNSDRFIQMNFVEFLEGIARMAETKSSLKSQEFQEKNENQITQEEVAVNESSSHSLFEGELHEKLEKMLERMQDNYDSIQIKKIKGNNCEKRSSNFLIKQPVKIVLAPLVPSISLSCAFFDEEEAEEQSQFNNQKRLSSNPLLLSPIPMLKQRSKTPENDSSKNQRRKLGVKPKEMIINSLMNISESDFI